MILYWFLMSGRSTMSQLAHCRSFYSPAWYAPYLSSLFSLFTLSVTAGNRGFLAIGDWLWAYHDELVAMGITALGEAYRLTAQFGGHGVATRLPGLLGLFISLLGHSTFALWNHCHRRQGAARILWSHQRWPHSRLTSGDYTCHGLYCRAGLYSRTLRNGVENEWNYCLACLHQTDGIARREFLDKGNSHNFYKVIFFINS